MSDVRNAPHKPSMNSGAGARRARVTRPTLNDVAKAAGAWQASGELGDRTFGRLTFITGIDGYDDQPYLMRWPRLAIYDMGVHLLDLARHFMGESIGSTAEPSTSTPTLPGRIRPRCCSRCGAARRVWRKRDGASHRSKS